MSFSSATDRRWPCSRPASFVWGAVVILLVCYLASSRYAPLALHSLIGASAASLGPLPVDALYQRHAASARSRLVAGLDTSCEERACVFKDVVVSLPLPAPELLKKGNGDGQGAKAMLNPEGLFGKNHDTGCVVYGLGISVDSSFEVGMTEFCETHAFDCTIAKNSEAIVGKPPNFHFHQTCIGRHTGIKETSGYGGQTWDLVFKPLKTVMSELGHRKVDVMKFDIEGSEVRAMLLPDGVAT
jgi:Methyltransferase domain